MKQKLIDVLSTFGYPVFLQGSLNEEEPYPDSFITFWVNDVPDNTHYDNNNATWDWDFSVIFYSNDPALVNSKPNEIRKALKAAGFIPQGKGQDIASDEPTHTGWQMDVYYIERNKN